MPAPKPPVLEQNKTGSCKGAGFFLVGQAALSPNGLTVRRSDFGLSLPPAWR